MEELAAKFIKAYANIPLGMREDIVVMIEDRPISWNAAYIEILSGTEKAKTILNELNELNII